MYINIRDLRDIFVYMVFYFSNINSLYIWIIWKILFHSTSPIVVKFSHRNNLTSNW